MQRHGLIIKPKPTDLPLISNETFFFIYKRYHHRLESWNLFFLQPPYLQRYVDAIVGRDSPLYNCFGFVDETISRILMIYFK